MFVSDKVVQQAVCPERRRGIDDSLSAMASVVEVEITNDLQVAKVYVSIYSDESVQRSERVFDLLKRIERIDSGEAPPPPVAIGDDDEDEFGVVWDDDEDGDAIGSVDLGFFDEEAGSAGGRPAGKEGGEARASGAGAAASQESEKDGRVDDEHVEEMLEFFRQDAARASRDRA